MMTGPAIHIRATPTTARGPGTGGAILGLFAIPLGIAGLGGVCQALRAALAAPGPGRWQASQPHSSSRWLQAPL